MTDRYQDEAIQKFLAEELADNFTEAIADALRHDYGRIVDVIAKNFEPDQIFDSKQLEQWARDNGWVREE